MGHELAIAVIHGMGSQETGFANPTIDELSNRVQHHGKDPNLIAWMPILWSDIVAPSQEKYLRRANRDNNLDYIRLRKFVISAVGDVGAYQKVGGANSTYEKIHKRVAAKIKNLRGQLDSEKVPLIILAHSLGAHIMSNYVWDMQKPGGAPQGLGSFEKMESLAGMVTFGCNIPLFTFAYSKVVPIKFPGKKLSPALKQKARWLNYYDPDDVLGYPLKPINAAYKKVVNLDKPINVGGVLSSWNPASHNKYWTDNSFTKPVAKFIAKFL